jgi:hypothetical protein
LWHSFCFSLLFTGQAFVRMNKWCMKQLLQQQHGFEASSLSWRHCVINVCNVCGNMQLTTPKYCGPPIYGVKYRR